MNSKGVIIEEIEVEYVKGFYSVLGKRKRGSSDPYFVIQEEYDTEKDVIPNKNIPIKKVIPNELEILAWCDFYVASKKAGRKIF